jgi:hypothetical protein
MLLPSSLDLCTPQAFVSTDTWRAARGMRSAPISRTIDGIAARRSPRSGQTLAQESLPTGVGLVQGLRSSLSELQPATRWAEHSNPATSSPS